MLLTSLYCCLNINNHFCNDPIRLNCGHYTCKLCLSKCVNSQLLKCKVCGMKNKRELKQFDEMEYSYMNVIRDQYENIFETIKKQFVLNVNKCKEIIENYDQNIDLQIQYAKEEVDIRIESIKIQLDEFGEKLKSNLDNYKMKCNNWKNDNRNRMIFNCDIDELKSEFDLLEDKIKSRSYLNENYLFECHQKLDLLNNLVTNFDKSRPYIRFKQNACSNINENTIGYLNLHYGNDALITSTIRNNVENEHFNVFNIHTSNGVYGLCELIENNCLLVSNYNSGNLLLYDENFKLLKTIEHFDNTKFQVVGMDTNKNGIIYLSDYLNHRIIKTDLDFVYYEQYGYEKGSNQTQLNSPIGICFSDESLYICDYKNKRILKLSSNLIYQSSYQFEYSPWYVKVLNNVACIRFDNSAPVGLCFYDTTNFTLIHKYNGHNGVIGLINNCFYEYYRPTKTIYCYDDNGLLMSSYAINFNNLIDDYNEDGEIVYLNNKLVIGYYGLNKLILI